MLSKEKIYETQRIFREIDAILVGRETQTFNNVALQRVVSSVCVLLLQRHAVAYNFE